MLKSLRVFLMLLALSTVLLPSVFAQQNAPTQNGRYQIIINPSIRADTWRARKPSATFFYERMLDDEKIQTYHFGRQNVDSNSAPARI